MDSTLTWQSNRFDFFRFGGAACIFFICALLHHPHTSKTPNPQNNTTLVCLLGGLISIKMSLVCHLNTAIRQPSSMDAPCCGVLHLVVLMRSEQPTQCSSMTKRPCSLGPTEVHVELIRGVRTCFSRSPWLYVDCIVVNQPKHHHADCWFRVEFWRNTARANHSSQCPMAGAACIPVQHTCICRTCYIGTPLISFSGLLNGCTSLIMVDTLGPHHT